MADAVMGPTPGIVRSNRVTRSSSCGGPIQPTVRTRAPGLMQGHELVRQRLLTTSRARSGKSRTSAPSSYTASAKAMAWPGEALPVSLSRTRPARPGALFDESASAGAPDQVTHTVQRQDGLLLRQTSSATNRMDGSASPPRMIASRHQSHPTCPASHRASRTSGGIKADRRDPKLGDLPSPMMWLVPHDFDPDQTRSSRFCEERSEPGPGAGASVEQATSPFVGDAMDLKDVLGQIEANSGNLHGVAPLISRF